MNLFALQSIRRRPKSALAALTLLAAAISVQAAPVEDYGINYTWAEGGWTRAEDRMDGASTDWDGGYLRGSFALGDTFYLLGGFSRNSGSDSLSGVSPAGDPLTAKFKTKLTQIELGLGFHVPVAERLDFVGEVFAIRFKNDIDVKLTNLATGDVSNPDADYKDTTYGGKALVGIRAKPFDMVDVWLKGGYFKMKENDGLVALRKSAMANVGIQLQLTPNFGLVGEADIYKKDFRYYRAGVRVSF